MANAVLLRDNLQAIVSGSIDEAARYRSVLRSRRLIRLLHPPLPVVVEDVLGDGEAEWNATDILVGVGIPVLVERKGVEHPMHAQVDSTAAVLLDHLPQATWKGANVSWPHRSLVVFVYPIEFFGDKVEILEQGIRTSMTGFYAPSVHAVCAIEESRDMESCGAEGGHARTGTPETVA